MAFINDEDYKVVIGDIGLKIISQASQENRDMAELEAIEEISGYLRPRYDTQAIFSAEGKQRNAQIVMYVCDVALYHLSASQPQRMGREIRQERYERAIKWLEGVSAGKIVPNLPEHSDNSLSNNAQQNTGLIFGSKPKLNNNW